MDTPTPIILKLNIKKISQAMKKAVDELGIRSAMAQGLVQPLTQIDKMRDNETLYVVKSGQFITGILKVGTKKLFLYDDAGTLQPPRMVPSILDFYIHESWQRQGLGRQLYDGMLADQNWSKSECAIDNPSSKMMNFLAKHYGLTQCIPQGNRFVVYKGFFEESGNQEKKYAHE